MEEKREIPLGELLKEALYLQEETDRLRNIELLLAAIEFMSVCAERIISEETAEKFDSLFDMVQDIRRHEETEAYEELLKNEMDFSWEAFRSWVLYLIWEDSYLKKHYGFYKDWTGYLNKFTVPRFFLEKYMELYDTSGCYFPQTGQLYYVHCEMEPEEYGALDEEDWWDYPEDECYIRTLRMLDLRKEDGRLYEFCDGEILYYGTWKFYYVKRNNSLCMTFMGVDWCVYYSLDTRTVEEISYHRDILGVTPQGEEILLRDGVYGSDLEVCYVDSDGEEQFVTNYRMEYNLRDGYLYTRKPYERYLVEKTYKIHMSGRKTYCNNWAWRKMIWTWMLDGIEPECQGYYLGGCGLIRSITRGLETLNPPNCFSCEEIRKRIWEFRRESKKNKRRTGRILACLALLEHMGIKKDEDMFEFWEQTALYWGNERGWYNIASKEFIKFLEKEAKEKDFVRKVYFAPALIYNGYKGRRARRRVEYRKYTSLADYFVFPELEKTFIGEFGQGDGGLDCDKVYLNEGYLRDGMVCWLGYSKKNLPGKVYYEFAGSRYVILWPKGLGIKLLEDVLEMFKIGERWRIVFEEE